MIFFPLKAQWDDCYELLDLKISEWTVGNQWKLAIGPLHMLALYECNKLENIINKY